MKIKNPIDLMLEIVEDYSIAEAIIDKIELYSRRVVPPGTLPVIVFSVEGGVFDYLYLQHPNQKLNNKKPENSKETNEELIYHKQVAERICSEVWGLKSEKKDGTVEDIAKILQSSY